jgi:hypothetical protein
MSKLAKFLRLGRSDRRLLLEASLLLLVARAALSLLAFKTVVRLIDRAAPARPLDPAAAAALVRRVRWAVLSGARNGPGRAVCFPQGIAAHLMLARRGVPSTLYYGVAKTPAGALEAHVWVRAGAAPVVGCAAAPRFALMTCFPRDRSAPAFGNRP